MPIVIDASVTMAWGFEDESTPYTEAVLDRVQAEGAIVPAIWPIEVANSILMGERRGRLTRIESAVFIDLLNDLPIDRDDETSLRAWTQILTRARELNLSAYDASYVDLASRRGLPLATTDNRMRTAAIGRHVNLVEFTEESNDANDVRD